jgi:uncharacterized membrane protein YcaP (DUF421 family)
MVMVMVAAAVAAAVIDAVNRMNQGASGVAITVVMLTTMVLLKIKFQQSRNWISSYFSFMVIGKR